MTGEAIYRSLYRVIEKKDEFKRSNTIRRTVPRNDNKFVKLKKDLDIKDKKIDYKRISVLNLTNLFKSNFILNNQSYKVVKEYYDPNLYRVTEEEIFQAEEGYCFGEWALIYNQPRSASVIALEDSVFFILDEKIFGKTFLKCLTNTEHKKKLFILENLFPFNLYQDRINTLYKDVVPYTCEKNQIIFKEGDTSDTIYLIYSGIYFLEKKFKNKTFRIKSVEKGCILGLESLFEGEKSKYRCTLKLSSLNEFGIVAYLKINKLLPYIAKKMREVFKENYLLYIKADEGFYEKNINCQKNLLFKAKGQTEESFEKYIADINYNENLEILKNKKIKFRNFKQIKLDKNHFLTENNNKKNNKFDALNIKKEKEKEIKKIKFNREEKKAKTIKLLNYGNFILNIEENKKNEKKNKLKKMNTLRMFAHNIYLEQENNKRNSFNNIKLNKIKSNKNKNKLKIKKVGINAYIKDLLSYNYKHNVIEGIKEKSLLKKKNFLKPEESTDFTKTFYGKNNFNNKMYISRNESLKENGTDRGRDIATEYKTVLSTEFPKIKKNEYFRFNSGKFKLPLMAHIFKRK